MADNNIQMQNIQSGKVTDKYFPITKAKNIQVSPSGNIPSTATDASKVFEALGKLAFDDGNSLVYLEEDTTDNDYTGELLETEIDDTVASLTKTWSSAKLKQIFELLGVTFDSNMNPSV